MDAKALAKSKRAHSQHHSNKKPHPSQKLKPANEGASSTANVKKGSNQHVTEKTREARRIAKLPSNRDRYEEEYELYSDANTSQPSDDIVPKSKGADYRHLIEEAQSQSQSYHHAESLASLDDVLPGELNQFLGSMLSVSGERILSWIGDDNFVVEDRTSASQEAAFLSLDLNALAEQLERVELSQRLFIEADLLPPESLGQDSTESRTSEQSDRMQILSEKKDTIGITEEQAIEFSEKVDIEYDVDDTSYDFAFKSGGIREPKSTAQDEVVSKTKLPTFEAATAEAELDMLLNSFNDTKFLNSSETKSPNSSTNSRKEFTPQPPIKLQDSSKTATVTASFDDVLDNLLEETNTLVNQNNSSQNNQSASSSSSGNVSKSKVLDDFDSWFDTIG